MISKPVGKMVLEAIHSYLPLPRPGSQSRARSRWSRRRFEIRRPLQRAYERRRLDTDANNAGTRNRAVDVDGAVGNGIGSVADVAVAAVVNDASIGVAPGDTAVAGTAVAQVLAAPEPEPEVQVLV